MSTDISPAERQARETARVLITCYLADAADLRLEGLIVDLMASATREELCHLVLVLVAACGETFDDLEHFSDNIVRLLGSAE